jgi:hypothetical protein
MGTNGDAESTTGLPDTSNSGAGTNINWKQRYNDLHSFSSRRETDLRKEITGLRTNQDTGFTAPKTPEELAAFKEENGDWFGVIETIAGKMAQDATSKTASRMTELESELKVTQADRALAQILVRHSDYAEITNSQDFHVWVATKSADLQALVYENSTDAKSAIEVLDFYKAENKSPRTTEQPQGSAADDVATGGQAPAAQGDAQGPAFSNATIQSMSPREYEANYEAIMEAQRHGRVFD